MKESILAAFENLFLALSDKTRLRLLALMAGGEVSVGFLADQLGESQPKISRHLAYLRNAGLVSARRDGKWIYYNVQKPTDIAVERILNSALFSITGVHYTEEPTHYEVTTVSEGNYVEAALDIYAETYENDYQPNEIEIYLL